MLDGAEPVPLGSSGFVGDTAELFSRTLSKTYTTPLLVLFPPINQPESTRAGLGANLQNIGLHHPGIVEKDVIALFRNLDGRVPQRLEHHPVPDEVEVQRLLEDMGSCESVSFNSSRTLSGPALTELTTSTPSY